MIILTILALVVACEAQGTAHIQVFDYVEDELTKPNDPALLLKNLKQPASIFEESDEISIDLHELGYMGVMEVSVDASSYDVYLERFGEGSLGYEHPIPGTLTLASGENALVSIDEEKDEKNTLKGSICHYGAKPEPKLDTAVVIICASDQTQNLNEIDKFRVYGSNTGCNGCKKDNELPITVVKDSAQFEIDDTNYPWNLTVYYANSPICSHDRALSFGPGGVYFMNVKSPEKNTTDMFSCIVGTVTEAKDFWQPLWIPLVILLIIILIIIILVCLNITYPRVREEVLRKMGRWTPEDETRPQEKKSTRLNSLDTFRGLAITIMIFVNFGGGKYFFLEHAAWNGLSLADFVFPWFMFMVGVSIVLSVQSQLKKGVSKLVILEKVTIRFIKLFVIGALLNTALPGGVDLTKWRFPGVLQRIGFTYFVCSLLEILFIPNLGATDHVGGERMTVSDDNEFNETGKFLSDSDYPEKKVSNWKFGTRVAADAATCRGRSLLFYTWPQWILIVIITAIWCGVSLAVAAPGCPQGYMGPGGLADDGLYPNCTGGIAGYIDRLIFGAHIYQHPTCKAMYKTTQAFDPEGLLGSLTSILTVYTGVLAGHVVVTCKSSRVGLLLRLIILTLCSLIIGIILCKGSLTGGWIPINKNLWTPSFVMITSASAYGILALCYFVVDFAKIWGGAPFKAAGKNPLFLYVGSSILYHFFPFNWSTPEEHGPLMLQALVGTICWLLVGVYLDAKKKYYKI